MRKVITTLLITIIVGTLFTGFVLAETGTVNVPELNFRENPSTNSDTLGVLNNGTKVNIISEQGDWYKIKYNNKEGYVSKQYVKKDASNNNNTNQNANQITPTPEPTTASNTVAPTTTPTQEPTGTIAPNTTTTEMSELNKTKIKEETQMYILPLLNSTKLGTINKEAKVLLISVNGDWAYIQTETHNAWVPSKKLESTKITLASNIQGSTSNQNNNEVEVPTTTPDQNKNNTTAEPTPTPESTTPPQNTTPTPEPTATPTPSSSQSYPTTMYVNVDAVNIRKEPNVNSSIVASAGKNVPVRVTAKEGDWYKVETSDGNGYIKGEFLSKTK